ncbi:hypothetical protein GGQ94_003216 [Petrimonas sulfuriphila]
MSIIDYFSSYSACFQDLILLLAWQNTQLSVNSFFRSLPANVLFIKPVCEEEFVVILKHK